MPCDTFNNWESNLRAIALTLEHLRSIERYGVTTDRQEQYTGWLKLSAANPEEEKVIHARSLISYSGLVIGRDVDIAGVIDSFEEFDRVWRLAVRRTHPDTGGNAKSFNEVIAARDRLKSLKGWK